MTVAFPVRQFSKCGPRIAALQSPGNLLKMHVREPHSKANESKTQGWSPICVSINFPSDS